MPATSTLSAVSSLDFGVSAPSLRTSSSHRGVSSAVAREFEAFVLQSFIEAMLPEKADSVLGTGTAGAFWKSMLAEQVAGELARAGGIGIARMIEAELAERSGGDS